jgi:hypothetical protein
VRSGLARADAGSTRSTTQALTKGLVVGKCTSLLVDSPRRRAADRATGLVADACGARRKKSRVSRRREKRHACRSVCAPLCICRSQLRARHVDGHFKYLKRAVKCYWRRVWLLQATLHQRVLQYPFPETSADTSACEEPLGLLSVRVYCEKQRQRCRNYWSTMNVDVRPGDWFNTAASAHKRSSLHSHTSPPSDDFKPWQESPEASAKAACLFCQM